MTQCPSYSTSIILASIISVIITALLATVISVLVQIALHKYHPKLITGGAELAASAGGEGQVYEKVDGGVAVSDDSTYMEVGGREGNAMELKENKSYGIVLTTTK